MGWRMDAASETGPARIYMEGELDLYSAPAFAREALAVLEGGELSLEFDATNLIYLDSTGVGAIIRVVKAARERGARVRWRGIGGMPRRVLAMSNILPLLREIKEGIQ